MKEIVLRRDEKFTLADAVQWALASNAVNDVLYGSEAMQRWGFSSGPHGERSPVEEFMQERSKGRLLPGHIYAETEKVLIEIANDREHNGGDRIRQFLRSTAYVPESLFYVMIGWPDKVILQPRFSFEAEDSRTNDSGSTKAPSTLR